MKEVTDFQFDQENSQVLRPSSRNVLSRASGVARRVFKSRETSGLSVRIAVIPHSAAITISLGSLTVLRSERDTSQGQLSLLRRSSRRRKRGTRHSPNSQRLPSSETILPELLTSPIHQAVEEHRETVAVVPEVGSSERYGRADVVSKDGTWEVNEGREDEGGMPETENETRFQSGWVPAGKKEHECPRESG